jgi:hypothetical protein
LLFNSCFDFLAVIDVCCKNMCVNVPVFDLDDSLTFMEISIGTDIVHIAHMPRIVHIVVVDNTTGDRLELELELGLAC